MGGFWNPIDFSGIVGYPHDISEDAIDNIPEFDHNHAGAHIVAFTKFIRSGVIHLFMRMFLCSYLSLPWFVIRKCLVS
jgi:hypothetical protein